MAAGAAGQLFVSNQDTNAVTTAVYSATAGGSAKSASRFFKLGKGNGVRGLAANAHSNLLFVADSDNDEVYALDATSGATKFTIDISAPIGLYLDARSSELFIGSHDKREPMVTHRALDRATRERRRRAIPGSFVPTGRRRRFGSACLMQRCTGACCVGRVPSELKTRIALYSASAKCNGTR